MNLTKGKVRACLEFPVLAGGFAGLISLSYHYDMASIGSDTNWGFMLFNMILTGLNASAGVMLARVVQEFKGKPTGDTK